jgi:hypothetical protein
VPVRPFSRVARRRAGTLLAVVAVTAALSLAACSDDSSSASTTPAPTAEDLAQARVSGDWAITLTIDTQTPPALDERLKQGDTVTRRYVLATGCDVDSPDCKVSRESGVGTSSEVWSRTGPLLRLHVEAPVTVSCVIDGEDTPVEYTATVDFSLEVTDAVAVGDGWTATSLAYDRTADIEPGPDAAAKGCKPGSQTESGSGTAASPAPVTTAQSPATTGATQTTGS